MFPPCRQRKDSPGYLPGLAESVYFEQTENFYQKLLQKNCVAELTIINGAPHQNSMTTEILEDAVRFIRRGI